MTFSSESYSTTTQTDPAFRRRTRGRAARATGGVALLVSAAALTVGAYGGGGATAGGSSSASPSSVSGKGNIIGGTPRPVASGEQVELYSFGIGDTPSLEALMNGDTGAWSDIKACHILGATSVSIGVAYDPSGLSKTKAASLEQAARQEADKLDRVAAQELGVPPNLGDDEAYVGNTNTGSIWIYSPQADTAYPTLPPCEPMAAPTTHRR